MRPSPNGPIRVPTAEEAEYRIDAYPLQQWNQYPGEGQEEDGFAEVGQCVCFGHRRVEWSVTGDFSPYVWPAALHSVAWCG